LPANACHLPVPHSFQLLYTLHTLLTSMQIPCGFSTYFFRECCIIVICLRLNR
jgi:hypothetical protein